MCVVCDVYNNTAWEPGLIMAGKQGIVSKTVMLFKSQPRDHGELASLGFFLKLMAV